MQFGLRDWPISPSLRRLQVFVLVSCLLYGAGALTADGSPPVTDPAIRRATTEGPVRVLVELRVPRAVGSTGDPVPPDREAVAEAQRAVLSRLPASHFSVVRRFETLPFLALEIDAAALTALETMGSLVARILVDQTLAPARRP